MLCLKENQIHSGRLGDTNQSLCLDPIVIGVKINGMDIQKVICRGVFGYMKSSLPIRI
jgi:hypothetical protein